MTTAFLLLRRLAVLAALTVCALAVPTVAIAVAWVWPLQPTPQVVRGFDPPAQRWSAGHRGVDLAGDPGAPVRAAGAGEVTYAGLLAGRGVVTVTHGALRTTYEPVDPLVSVGRRVDAGEVIGLLTGGGHCRPAACLHWGLLRGQEYLDPLSLLRAGPSRLLPVWGVPAPYAAAVPSGPRAAPRHPALEPQDRTLPTAAAGGAGVLAAAGGGVAWARRRR